ncbi:hypothetical protein ACEQ8H_003616 [Pleosporales sp. CAS-2024a]
MAGMPASTSMSTSSGMAMAMDMTFFTSSKTPLFSTAWTPTSAGQYAGTCIFLIIFAAIFRALLAIRLNIIDILSANDHRHGRVAHYPDIAASKWSARRPWRANEAVVLASVDVVLSAVGYLLMIAVMTMNVGYFLSVLAGIFVGSIVFGRFMAHSVAH